PPIVAPARLEPPGQRVVRRKGINALPDNEAVKNHSPQEIIDAASASWRSIAYGHYEVSLEQRFDHDGNFIKLVFVFHCKHKEPKHDPVMRDRLRTGDGTRNLLSTARACDNRRGVPSGVDPTGRVSIIGSDLEFSEALHVALLAIECARDHRPFSSVTSDLRQAEVQLLRPGTQLPTAATISNYVRRIYIGASVDVAEYLQNIPGALHLAVDGWTCPTSESYLGVIVFWLEGREMWRAILEFIRQSYGISHGRLQYGIEHKLRAICLDNASNNNTLVRQLGNLVPTFRGSPDRIRCVAHVLNLMAKAFMALLDASSTRARITASDGVSSAEAAALAAASSDGDDPSNDPQDSTSDVDPDKLQHDTGVVQGVAAQAVELMREWGTAISTSELASSRQIAGLARRDELFRELVRKDPELQAIASHLHFKGPVQWLTGKDGLKLKKYALTEHQWKLAHQLSEVLELLALRARLFDIRDDVFKQDLSPVIRTGAEAALLVFDKYIGNMGESDFYTIAVVMCPDRKLKWFADWNYAVEPIRTQVIARFTELFPEASIHSYLETPVVPPDVIRQCGGVIPYWNNQLDSRPRLARMALDYLTAPASSVDAERAFSSGRLMINHLQHQMSSRTFQSQMAIGSWFGTPLLPNLSSVASIVKSYM
ncbi:unnamed protein product, partial [Rhizoctonia solani]